jgi:myo-inositol-1(or 4)-monophosphatase
MGANKKAKAIIAPTQIARAIISIIRMMSRMVLIARRIPLDPLDIAIDLAKSAGALLRDRLHDERTIAEKHPRDLVTDADRASEALIVERLHDLRPESTILGEESGVTQGTNDERWIIDPLDGTTNYAHRYPMFCVSIACERAGVLVAGAIYAPMLDELYGAAQGRGATCNGKPIHVSNIQQLREAMTCTGFTPGRNDRNMQNFGAVSREAQAVRRDGSAALNLASLALGRFDGFWEFDLKPWDVAAGAIIVREAGGRVTTLDGAPWSLKSESILATNGTVHTAMEEILSLEG